MLRVIQWATGTVGVHAAPAIARHPDLELAGLWVHSASKVGRDAGEICGVEPLGVAATDDVGALLALGADCITYMASSDIRPDEVVADLCRMLASGHNVVNTSFVPLINPRAADGDTLERLDAACQEGGTSIYSSGIDPGFGNVGLAVQAMSLCEQVRSVRMMEIVNYAGWDHGFNLFEIMGFGKPDPSDSLLLAPGSTAMAWGPVLHLVADALGVELDGVEEHHEIIRAEAPVVITAGTIPVGGISGMRFEIRGMVGGEARIVVEHVTRMQDEDAPHWPQGDGYRVVIDGEPSVEIEMAVSSRRGDTTVACCLATAMHVINAIPAVCAAAPGVLTYLDVPVYSARHLLTPTLAG